MRMSCESFISVSKIIPLVHLLQSNLSTTTAVNESSSPECNLMAELKRQMKRFSQIESNHTVAASTVLDLRFKKIAFCSTDSCERTIDRISGEVCDIIPNQTAEVAAESITKQNNASAADSES